MKVIRDGGHNEMCSGYSYHYNIELENEYTINDIVNAIHNFQKEYDTGDGAYGIYVNNEIIESTWSGERINDKLPSYKKRYEGDMNKPVISVYGDGGWYCRISFHITV